jgi:hypothetical protein
MATVAALAALATAPAPALAGRWTSLQAKSTQTSPQSAASGSSWHTLSEPISESNLRSVPFGTRSYWVQPWRAYMDTRPASALQEGLGINFNVTNSIDEPVAQVLQETGFTLARVGINWQAISYENPAEFSNPAGLRARLEVLKAHGLRPLILLDANSESPAPSVPVTLTTTTEAKAGSAAVQLTASSAAEVVPGKTGFDDLTFGGDPDVLITAVSARDVATLSAPLKANLPAGEHKGRTLRYAPFGKPTLPNGQPNPLFRETMEGWLKYVSAVCHLAASAVGPNGYDLEVWNELSFGSQFLKSEAYYKTGGGHENTEPVARETEESMEMPELETATEESATTRLLLDETVRLVRAPGSGIPAGVGITDGFASQTPFPSGANAPVGLTALSKHPYNGWKEFPAAQKASPIRNVNAVGGLEGGGVNRLPSFAPTFDSLFPEYFLTGISTENLVREVAPITTEIYGFPHGREVGPVGGEPVQKWITEYTLVPGKHGVPTGPQGEKLSGVTVTPRDHEHFLAKALLRSLTAMINKGFSREYIFAAANARNASVIGEAFMNDLKTKGASYPGFAAGGEVVAALHNLVQHFAGPGLEGQPRQLQLESIAQLGNHAQFSGNGTTAHPALYDREVLAVLPFESAPNRFVIPYYVMTRDLLTDYQPSAPSSDLQRFDLPDESFRITFANLPSGTPKVSSYDPITGSSSPTKVVEETAKSTTIEVAATDYPRLLQIEY